LSRKIVWDVATEVLVGDVVDTTDVDGAVVDGGVLDGAVVDGDVLDGGVVVDGGLLEGGAVPPTTKDLAVPTLNQAPSAYKHGK
jgi:hypothetical protein